MNNGANNAGNQLIQGKFKVSQCHLALGKHRLFQVIQCHLDPSEGHMGVAAISLFLRDAGHNFFPQYFTDSGHVGKNEEKVEGGGMKVDSATAAFADWLRQLPAHLVRLVCRFYRTMVFFCLKGIR